MEYSEKHMMARHGSDRNMRAERMYPHGQVMHHKGSHEKYGSHRSGNGYPRGQGSSQMAMNHGMVRDASKK